MADSWLPLLTGRFFWQVCSHTGHVVGLKKTKKFSRAQMGKLLLDQTYV